MKQGTLSKTALFANIIMTPPLPGTDLATRWSSRVSLPRISEGCVTKFAPRKTPKLIAPGKLTFDERVVFHRVDRGGARA